MNGIQIEFLVGLFLAANSIDGSFKSPSVHVVKLIIGVILVVLAVFSFDILALA